MAKNLNLKLYEDDICEAYFVEGCDGFDIYYRFDFTPKPHDVDWIERQIKVLASKLYNRGWVLRYRPWNTPTKWEIRADPANKMCKRWKIKNQYKRRKLD